MAQVAPTDVELLEASASGRHDAFAELVKRYQSLVCAVSYCATGNRALSEDVAQETFVVAWHRLSDLREPSKLRSWLCGIARNVSAKALRRSGREVPSDASVQAAIDAQGASASPLDAALKLESETLVWAALHRIPEAYREPLVLFYREDRSTKQVAEALGLSEQTVQKRLSRGRHYLKEHVAELVERTLERTKPSKAFAAGVLAAISAGAAQRAEAAGASSASASSGAGAASALAGGMLTMKALKTGTAVVLVLLAVSGMFVMGGSKGDGVSHDRIRERISPAAQLAILDPNRDRPAPQIAKRAIASGRVIDAATGVGVAGATLVLTDSALDAGAAKRPGARPAPITIVSGLDGSWSLERVPRGLYAISATADGYVPGVLRGVELEPGGQRTDLELEIEPGGERVTGSIADIGGGPIQGAFVSATRLDRGRLLDVRRPAFAAVSGTDGQYRLSLEAGTYELVVAHDDYASHRRTVDVARPANREDFRLAPGSVLEGRVLVAGSEAPVSGALVTISGGFGETRATGIASTIAEQFDLRGVVSDREGRFRFAGVGSGSVELAARAAGYASVQPVDLDLRIAEHVSDLVVWVEPAPTVSGHVVAKGDGAPIAGALVMVSQLEGGLRNYVAPNKTGDDGYFELVGVKPGTYFASAVAEGRTPQFMATHVRVEGDDVDDLVIEVEGGARLAGRVEPAKAAQINLRVDMGETTPFGTMFAALGAVFLSTETDATGSFVLGGAPVGKLELIATSNTGLRGLLPVTVEGDGQSGLVIQLESMASISGQVVDEDGQPVAGHRVRIHRADSSSHAVSIVEIAGGEWVTTGDDGRFHAAGLEAGDYQLSVHGKGAAQNATSTSFMLPFVDDEAPWEPKRLRLSARESKSGLSLKVARSRGQLEGIVVDERGEPVADAWVAARWNPPAGIASSPTAEDAGLTITDADGTFHLGELREGEYRLIANDAAGGGRARADSVRTGDSVTLELAALGELTGRVTRDGEPVRNFRVRLDGPSRLERTIRSTSGEFALTRLEAGSYQLRVIAGSGATSEVIEVRAGQKASVELSLAGWGSVSGRVVSLETGEPLAGRSVLTFAELDNRDRDGFANMATGFGPRTDADGRFRIDDLGHGKGMVAIYSGGFRASEPIGSSLFGLRQGQHLDLGDVRAISPPPRLSEGERGSLGLTVEMGIWAAARTNPEISTPSFDPDDRVLRVTCVVAMHNAPAAAAGMTAGDEILAIDGVRVADIGPQAASLMLRDDRVRIDQRFDLRLRRGATSFEAQLVAIPAEDVSPAACGRQ